MLLLWFLRSGTNFLNSLSATSFLLCSAELGSKNVAFTSFHFLFILHVFASRCRSTVHTRMLSDGYGSPQIQKLRVNMFSLNQVTGVDHESWPIYRSNWSCFQDGTNPTPGGQALQNVGPLPHKISRAGMHGHLSTWRDSGIWKDPSQLSHLSLSLSLLLFRSKALPTSLHKLWCSTIFVGLPRLSFLDGWAVWDGSPAWWVRCTWQIMFRSVSE